MSIGATGIAFVGYPVTDVDRAKHFYGEVLGLTCYMDHTIHEDVAGSEGPTLRWVEFEVGEGTIAISNAWPPSGQSGPTAALEVADLDAALKTLKEADVPIASEVMASPSCRFFMIADPDGNALTIHQMNPDS